MSSRARRLTPIVLACLCGALATGCDRDRAAALPDEALHALVDSMLPDLARLASLEVRAPVRLERRTAQQVRAYVESRLDEELPPARIRELQTIYSLLGVIPDTLDLRRLLLELYTEQIIGYYDPQAGTLYVVEGVEPEAVAPVLAHELVHALQDQHSNLDSLLARERGNDRQSAAHAALEGHATIVMFAFLAEQAQGTPIDPVTLPNPAEQLATGLQAQNDQFPVFRSAPAIIRETTLFPYVQGADFVYRLWQAQARSRPAPLGEWLPQSTEQVLHPDRFLARDEPTSLHLADNPAGWRSSEQDNGLGEFETSVVLGHHLGARARASANGWDGDVYRLLTNENGQHVLLWYSVWDDAVAADRFAAAVRGLAEPARHPTFQVERVTALGMPGVRVLIVPRGLSLDPAQLPALQDKLPPAQ